MQDRTEALESAAETFDIPPHALDIAPAIKSAGLALGTRGASREATREIVGNLPKSTSVGMLIALNVMGKHLYAGTVGRATIAKRRAANKRARIARRASR